VLVSIKINQLKMSDKVGIRMYIAIVYNCVYYIGVAFISQNVLPVVIKFIPIMKRYHTKLFNH
jgi:predicted histidine transporter YuiF (NhaC family)